MTVIRLVRHVEFSGCEFIMGLQSLELWMDYGSKGSGDLHSTLHGESQVSSAPLSG